MIHADNTKLSGSTTMNVVAGTHNSANNAERAIKRPFVRPNVDNREHEKQDGSNSTELSCKCLPAAPMGGIHQKLTPIVNVIQSTLYGVLRVLMQRQAVKRSILTTVHTLEK